MEKIFVSNIEIEHVRHLNNIKIPLSKEQPKHLILTGRNGSGKTSVLEALASYISNAATSDDLTKATQYLKMYQKKLDGLKAQKIANTETLNAEKYVSLWSEKLNRIKCGVCVEFNILTDEINYQFEKSQFIIAYYKADRIFKADIPKHVEKVELQDKYLMNESPRQIFVKYLLDLKVTEALARNNGKFEKADNIRKWFSKFQDLLRRIFEDDTLELIFEEDNFTFLIKEKNREPFDFNTLSSGFAAVLDIVLDIIVRMEKATNRSFDFYIPGIVLIDEIETHLHLELQKTILQLLTTVFPNIQFIVSTHSPFILNSLDNVVIYDLENHVTVRNGLSDVPYSGIVEGYFNADAEKGIGICGF